MGNDTSRSYRVRGNCVYDYEDIWKDIVKHYKSFIFKKDLCKYLNIDLKILRQAERYSGKRLYRQNGKLPLVMETCKYMPMKMGVYRREKRRLLGKHYIKYVEDNRNKFMTDHDIRVGLGASQSAPVINHIKKKYKDARSINNHIFIPEFHRREHVAAILSPCAYTTHKLNRMFGVKK